ncbi:MAG: hypothetical protein NE330_12870 [Lentisphaeraceae bacterium]|nr:hypothetical protein [Lentisphaeraceae bacterium]
MKGILCFTFLFCYSTNLCFADHVLANKVTSYLFDVESDNKQKKKKKDPVKYSKDLGSTSYIALYFSNAVLDKRFKDKLNAASSYYSALKKDKRYSNQEIPGNIEFIYVTTGTTKTNDKNTPKFPYIDLKKVKSLMSINRFSPRKAPGMVVVSSSGQIKFLGQPESVIESLEKLIPVENNDSKK